MEKEIVKSDWFFLLICLLLGIVAEESFFVFNEIGISFMVFLLAFYGVFFWRYRRFSFSHQRFGYLVLICIWLLSASYFTHFTLFFYGLNILVIPSLVIFHIVLVTSPKKIKWNRLHFIYYVFSKLIDAVKYNASFAAQLLKAAQKGIDKSQFSVVKKVLIGAAITVPVLFVVLPLLMSADSQFEKLIGGFPDWFNQIDVKNLRRIIFVLIASSAFFGVFQVLLKKQIRAATESESEKLVFQIDEVIAATILVLMNIVYLLFVFIQFKYFFGGALQEGFTYAQYARKGFFELLFVTIINLSLTVFVLTFVQRFSDKLHRFTQSMLTVLVCSSAVILCSSFMRLSMYEEAYGFTFTRILVHSFMIFLAVVFAYTLIKIWIEKLSLFHFYFIIGICYYTVINTVDLNQIVVSQNISRYEASGKIDVQYLDSLSYTGVLGLISLYEKHPNISGLKSTLEERKQQIKTEKVPWQSYNFKRQQVKDALQKLELN